MFFNLDSSCKSSAHGPLFHVVILIINFLRTNKIARPTVLSEFAFSAFSTIELCGSLDLLLISGQFWDFVVKIGKLRLFFSSFVINSPVYDKKYKANQVYPDYCGTFILSHKSFPYNTKARFRYSKVSNRSSHDVSIRFQSTGFCKE